LLPILKKQNRKKPAAIVMVIIVAGILTACTSTMAPKDPTYEAESFAMGTIVTQKVTGAKGQTAMDEVTGEIKSLEKLLTFRAPEGDVYKLNENAGIKNVALDPATVKIIKKAIQVAELSGGTYDITVGPLVRSWAIGTPQQHIPSKEELQKILPLVNYKDIYVDEHSGGLKRAGQMIDLGGIAKGYAGDVAIQIYKKYGIQSAFINIGGNVVTLGNKPDGSPWKIGIRNPRPKENETQGEQLLGYITVKDKAVSTAGNDQRYFEIDGQRYHHIFDPKTGYPAKLDLMSVTLVTDSSLDSDAFDTAVFILGLEKGKELLRQRGNVEAIFITTDKKIYVTNGLKDKFTFYDESNEYRYVR
jgi:thiamine biosynthesis lipoprotein